MAESILGANVARQLLLPQASEPGIGKGQGQEAVNKVEADNFTNVEMPAVKENVLIEDIDDDQGK